MTQLKSGTKVIVDGKPAIIVYRGNDTYVIVRQDDRDFAVALGGLQLARMGLMTASDEALQAAEELLADEYAPTLSNSEHSWLKNNIARLCDRFVGVTGGEIDITNPRDLAFMKIAQGSLVNSTVLPSGTRTPPINMIIRGNKLVPSEPA